MSAHSENTAADEYETLPVGRLSPLQEDEAHYYAVAVMKKGKDRLKLATVAWLKEPLRSWLAKAEAQLPTTMAAVSADYTLPVISGESDDSIPSDDSSFSDTSSPSVACTDNTWTATSASPLAREYHTAVWTGSEMIVWGGYNSNPCCTQFNTGGRYNPSTDSWTATSTTNVPSARFNHTAVWTGSEMIVWGGQDSTGNANTGGRYNPGTDSWTATTTSGAPDGRYYHTAVWTGSEMIVWGGWNASTFFNTGGRYNPSTNSWTATTTTSAPDGRYLHTAVWTGNEMIVWGGFPGYFNTGGRYNPGSNSWTATSTTNAPDGRAYHTAVWTGSKMIVWGGQGNGTLNTGGRYNPGTNSWAATSTTNAPEARIYHTAVLTSTSEMVVWGGLAADGMTFLNTGGRYNPGTDTWSPTSSSGAPAGRIYHTAVSTGTEMIVWGGTPDALNVLNTGGRYNPKIGRASCRERV
jgi:N-acetylneuraminic acid mutarotase